MRCLAAVTAALVLAAAGPLPAQAPALKETLVRTLGVLPANADAVVRNHVDLSQNVALSLNARRMAWVVEAPKGVFEIRCDGKSSPKVSRVYGIGFSGDGKRLVSEVEDGGRALYVDGRRIDGAHAWHFSPDGLKLAYTTENKDGVKTLWLDGTRVADGAIAFDFSLDSKHFGYCAAESAVIDGKQVLKCDAATGLALAAWDLHWAVIGRFKDRRMLVTDSGSSVVPYDAFHPVISPDGSRFGYVRHPGEKFVNVVDETAGPASDRESPPIFSPDSKHYAYRIAVGGEFRVVCDGRVSAAIPGLLGLAFSSDSRHILWTASGPGAVQLYCDGVPAPVHWYVALPPDQSRSITAGKVSCAVLDRQADGSVKVDVVEADAPADRTWESAFPPAPK